MNKVDALIVGGGIAGMASALTLQDRSRSYMIIEAANELGGLLRSRTYENYSFDYGTHFINYTFNPDVDSLLMPKNIDENWHQYSYLKAGSYFNCLNESSPLIAANDVLPADIYAQGLVELLDSLCDESSFANLRQQVIQFFGVTFAESIIIPAMEKLFFSSTENLIPNAHLRYGLHRLIVSTPAVSILLKKIPELDARIAFHSSLHSSSDVKHLYPRKGGVGCWIDELSKRLSPASVKLQAKVVSIELNNDGYKVSLSTGQVVHARYLVWTLPAAMFFHALGEKHQQQPPKLLNTELFHLVFDRPFTSSIFYITDYDPKHCLFRTTLYSNAQTDDVAYRATVEVLKNNKDETPLERIIEELQQSGLIDKNAKLIFSARDFLPNTFPVLDHTYAHSQAYFSDKLALHPNVCFVGKSGSDQFFMTDILVDCYKKMKNLTF